MSPPRRRRAPSSAAGHVAWMRLLDVSGPFLSVPVLQEAFPQGLDADDPELARELGRAFGEWEASAGDRALHNELVDFVLTRVLEYDRGDLGRDVQIPESLKATLPEHRLTLRPDIVVAPEGGEPALLVVLEPAGRSLDRATETASLVASPAECMRLLLRGAGVATGLVTNGEQWMLVHAPSQGTPTFATWHAPLLTEERETLRAFRSLLGVRRVLGRAGDDSLDGLLARSAEDEREVTDALGDQARRAVELLVGAFDQADHESGGALLAGIEPPTLYEATVAAAMRVIFLLAAEGQGLLPDDGPWADSYAVTPMRAALREDVGRGGEEALERRFDAWARLCATTRAVHGGVAHDRVRLPGYGGGLFDPGRFPFLEGRGRPPRISNRVILRVLDNLQTLQVKVPGGGIESRPISFAALGVEQIGHVYERLLEHTAVRTTFAALGLAGAKGREPELSLDELEERQLAGDEALFRHLVEHTGRSLAALQRDLAREPDALRLQALRTACQNDEELLDRILPFAGLVRDDPYGRPAVFLPERVYVTERTGGRAFQSHYTPSGLTEPIVRHALEPVVYEGPAEGWEPERWRLRTPGELLDLKVCDIAMGSAAFLVAACRFLAARLVESWEAHPGQAPPGLPADLDERDLTARRLIAERCIYGVDKNPLAVDIAKVSMWLATLRRDRPFTFLDHALRCGDSLVGITDVRQFEALSLDADSPLRLLADPARERIREALVEVRTLRGLVSQDDPVDLRAVEQKQALLAQADRTARALKGAADLVVGAALSCAGTRTDPDLLVEAQADALGAALTAPDGPDLTTVRTRAGELLLAGRVAGDESDLRPFHWPLEFPEVFGGGRAGFDAIVGNPPFLGGKALTGTFGLRFREHLVERLARGARGSADLCAYFFLRAHALLAEGGCMALLATNTIAQGDTREVGLARLEREGAAIYRAVPSRPWPGLASLEVAQVWLRRGEWTGPASLAEEAASAITSYLTRPGRVVGDPHRLAANAGRALQGAIVLGMGFVLSPEEAAALIERDPRNRDVLFPYLTGEDLQSRPDQSPSRWVVNFFDWPIERAAHYEEPFAILDERVRPERESRDAQKYPQMVYEWWKFWRSRPELGAALAEHPLAFVRALVSNTHALARLPERVVIAHKCVVFVADAWGEFAILQSGIHEAWAVTYSSTLGTGLNYSPTDCFETFPFPDPLPPGEAGRELHDLRAQRTRARGEGLTKLANRVNDPDQNDPDLVRLRELMVEIDRQVVAAYGWDGFDLAHGFHETRFGRRFTIGPAARDEVLDRLLELNHQRHAEEVRQGLHAGRKKRAGGRRPRRAASSRAAGQGGLF